LNELPWALRTRIDETAIIDSTGVFWMEFLRRRREFITLLGGTIAAWPLGAQAQLSSTGKRIGFISSGSPAGIQPRFACFMDGLLQLGWIEGQTISVEQRWAIGNSEPLALQAEKLTGLKLDLIVAAGTPAAQVMQRTTRDIPVVFLMVSDPVASGIVKSLARPGENVTGFSNFLPATTGKLLELIKTAVPAASRIAFLYDPANEGKLLELREVQASAQVLGVTLEPRELRTSDDIERAFTTMARTRPEALIIPSDGVTIGSLRQIIGLASAIRIPAIYQTREFVEAGGLMSYGLNVCQHYRRAASYVDKILKGARPVDLPVEQPTTFELLFNVKTAKALGLEIPPTLLALAHEVIE
jgi:putative tryptophan/tyrosine transport system substrate-binding protein